MTWCILSLDRSTVASSHGDHTIKVFSLRTGKLLTTLSGHSRTAWCLSYHPSLSSIIASGSLAGEIRVWDLNVTLFFYSSCATDYLCLIRGDFI